MSTIKKKRQDSILELINNKVIVTQDDLQDQLVSLGYTVTQSTVSRDIKEMRIIKAQDLNGIYRYISPKSADMPVQKQSKEHYIDIFSKSVTNVDYALNNIVIKCYVGMANSACVAFEELFSDIILGSLAGDDTVIVVTRTENDAKTLTEKLRELY